MVAEIFNRCRKSLWIIVFTLLFFTMMPYVCNAKEWSRAKKIEIFALGQAMGGDEITDSGMTLEIDDFFVGGFGMGMNYNDYLNLNYDMFFGSTDATGRAFGTSVTLDANALGMDLNLDVNILKGRLTPLVTGGVGFINFNGDEFDETDFSYNLGCGLRWDISDHVLLKAIYRATWTTLKDTDNSIQFDGISLSLGCIF